MTDADRRRLESDSDPAEPAARGSQRRPARIRGAWLRLPLTIVALAAALIATIWLASGPVLDGVEQAAGWSRARDDSTGRAVATVLVVGASGLVLVVAWARSSGLRRPVRVAQSRGTIPIDELERRLAAEVAGSDRVERATIRVANHGRKGVTVRAELHVASDARIAQTTLASARRVEAFMTEQLGVSLAEPPALTIRYEELRLRPRRIHA